MSLNKFSRKFVNLETDDPLTPRIRVNAVLSPSIAPWWILEMPCSVCLFSDTMRLQSMCGFGGVVVKTLSGVGGSVIEERPVHSSFTYLFTSNPG